MTFWKWSKTSASNGTADASINYAEGMAPSGLNDSGRAVMAAAAKYRDDIAGAIVTGGTSTAYTVSSNQSFDTLAHLDGAMIAFSPHTTAGATVTLNVDGLGAKPLRSAPGAELPAGTLIQGTPYVVTYSFADGAFYLHGFYGNPYNVPLAAGLDYWGSSTPNSSFAFPAGQAISRTTYSALFAITGTTYGPGDGSTTFNLPDKTERVSVMKAASASRLTSAISGIDGGTLGATGGVQNRTIAQANLPSVNFTVGGTVNILTSGVPGGSAVVAGSSQQGFTSGSSNNLYNTGSYGTLSATLTAATAASGGLGTALPTAQPTIVCNYIFRII